MNTNIAVAVLVIIIILLSWYVSPMMLLLLFPLLGSKGILGGNSWKCVNRDAKFCHKCEEDSSNNYWPRRGLCEDLCTYEYEHKGKNYRIKYPIPIEFIDQMGMPPKSTDFQNFLTDQRRFSKIARFISAVNWKKSDPMYDFMKTMLPKDTYITKGSVTAYYVSDDKGYEELENRLKLKIDENDELMSSIMNKYKIAANDEEKLKWSNLALYFNDAKKKEEIELELVKALKGTGKHYCTIIDSSTFTKNIEELKQHINNNQLKEEIVIPLSLVGTGAHANMLIYNKTYNRVFIFEPHVESSHYQDDVKKEGVKRFFSNILDIDAEIISLRDYFSCPLVFERRKKFLSIQTSDELCQSWSVFAVILHLNNPNVPIEAIYGSLMNVQALEYISKFLYYMENEFKYKPYYKEYTITPEQLIELPFPVKHIHKIIPRILQA
jgi:hypothetical protein